MTVSITTFCIKCRYAECRDLFIDVLNVVMLSVVMLSIMAPLSDVLLKQRMFYGIGLVKKIFQTGNKRFFIFTLKGLC